MHNNFKLLVLSVHRSLIEERNNGVGSNFGHQQTRLPTTVVSGNRMRYLPASLVDSARSGPGGKTQHNG